MNKTTVKFAGKTIVLKGSWHPVSVFKYLQRQYPDSLVKTFTIWEAGIGSVWEGRQELPNFGAWDFETRKLNSVTGI